MNGLVISSLIKEYRCKSGMSQGEFGKMLGVSANAVSKWERDICYPDLTSLPRLADILGIEINDLFAKEK